MFKNLLQTSLRNLSSKKGFSFLNVGGLAIGLSCFILIGLFVQNELSYDLHNEKADQIHKMGLHLFLDGTESNFAVVAAPVARGLLDEFPEVEASTRFSKNGVPVLRYENKAFSEEDFYWADSTVFDVFTIPFVVGDRKTALTGPYTIVFTESMAEKYFGKEDPIGKVVTMDGRQDYTVTGVVKDAPEASHAHYDFLGSSSSREMSNNTSWATQNNFGTYFVLNPSVSASEFQEKLKALVVSHVYPEIAELFNAPIDAIMSSGTEFEYLVMPLTDIHLKSRLRGEHETSGNILYVWLFGGIAIAILLIACINYINLSTAISSRKAKEVGVRKALGSSRGQLIAQFMSDSLVLSFLSVACALILVELFLPVMNSFADKNLELSYFDNWFVIPGLLGLAIVVGFLAGSYPAFLLSSFNPAAVLKGGGPKGKSKSLLRNGLIVFQYSVSAVLVLSSLVVYGQLKFIQNTNLGFSGDQVIVVEKTDDIPNGLQSLKQNLLRNAAVVSVGNSSSLFGDLNNDNMFRADGQPETENKLIWTNNTDEGFAETYKLEMVDGSYFTSDTPLDRSSIVLNETAVALLGLENPVGQKLHTMFAEGMMTVVGVVKDFHVESLQNEIKPFGFVSMGEGDAGRNLSVRVSSADMMGVIGSIEEEWYKVSNGQAFEYEFFDSVFQERYMAEQDMGRILIVFSILAVLIACLGLFGLAAFVTTQRTKEIGIRKSLGASASGIVMLLFKDFGKWIILANVIAWPLAYVVMNNWLQNFVFKTEINLFQFPIALIGGLIVAFITISYTTIKAAQANPVYALKSE
ncbi:ABC transporter permease [bacterium]|nr:ABC transporter permease [bacterium]